MEYSSVILDYNIEMIQDLNADIKYIELIASFMSYSFETFDEYFNLTNPSVDSFKILIRDFNEALDEKHRESSE